MMKFSKKVEYALIALLYMAKRSNGELTTARELSDKFAISLELMGKILQSLVHSGLVISVQGVKGGYYLGQKMDRMNLSSVITAIDGPIAITDCLDSEENTACEREKYCPIRNSMERIQEKLVHLLNEITLKDFEKTYRTSSNR